MFTCIVEKKFRKLDSPKMACKFYSIIIFSSLESKEIVKWSKEILNNNIGQRKYRKLNKKL